VLVIFEPQRLAPTDCVLNRRLRCPDFLLLVGLLCVGWFAACGSTVSPCRNAHSFVFPIGTATTTCTGGLAVLLRLPLHATGAKLCSYPHSLLDNDCERECENVNSLPRFSFTATILVRLRQFSFTAALYPACLPRSLILAPLALRHYHLVSMVWCCRLHLWF
jgi:hypothetical protein